MDSWWVGLAFVVVLILPFIILAIGILAIIVAALVAAWRNRRARLALAAFVAVSVVANLLGYRFPQQFIVEPLARSICSVETIWQSPSPGGGHVAWLLRQNCGATTPFVVRVMVRKTWDLWGLGSQWVLVTEHSNKGTASWIDENTLLVEYDGEVLGDFTESWDGIKFVYRRMGEIGQR